MAVQYLKAERALTGDGKTVLSPAWVGFEGKWITYTGQEKPADAVPAKATAVDETASVPASKIASIFFM